ncbi:MAG: Fe-S cluster assembly ATPase SufC [Elusimicrobia bacterium]|nr:Fe-S cluster assembly ATPase SufC [Elusimicrobiota bacterium]
MPALLEVQDLHAEVDGKPILKGLDLKLDKGEVHAIMGPNGSGKSTFSNVLLGHPSYKVTSGRILFKGEDVTQAPTYERARKGMFLAFQYPTAIPGVTVANFLRTALKAVSGDEKQAVKTFRKVLREKMALLEMDDAFATRYVNDGFSGGEKKRLEILQMAVLNPALAVLDETDSGLDIDALRIVCAGINAIAGPEKAVLVITHYQRMLDYVKPHYVHVLMEGRIEKSGGPELALELERTGYFGRETAAAGA